MVIADQFDGARHQLEHAQVRERREHVVVNTDPRLVKIDEMGEPDDRGLHSEHIDRVWLLVTQLGDQEINVEIHRKSCNFCDQFTAHGEQFLADIRDQRFP